MGVSKVLGATRVTVFFSVVLTKWTQPPESPVEKLLSGTRQSSRMNGSSQSHGDPIAGLGQQSRERQEPLEKRAGSGNDDEKEQKPLGESKGDTTLIPHSLGQVFFAIVKRNVEYCL